MFPLQKFRFFLALPPPPATLLPIPTLGVGRAPALHAGGRRFDSVQLHPPFPVLPSSPTSPPDMSSVTLRKPEMETVRPSSLRTLVEVVGFSEGDGRHVRGACRRAWLGGGGDGAGRSRTDGLLRAKQALCQLSYSPERGDWEKCSIGGEGARGKNGIFGAETWIFTRFDAKCPFVHENT